MKENVESAKWRGHKIREGHSNGAYNYSITSQEGTKLETGIQMETGRKLEKIRYLFFECDLTVAVHVHDAINCEPVRWMASPICFPHDAQCGR